MNLGVSPVCGNNMNSSQCSSTMNLLRGYEDLGVSPLENACVAKRCRYLNPNNTIYPMGYGLVTSLYKYKHKKPIVHNNHFDRLPEEVILHVFKMLDKRTLTKCTYVCSQWRRIAYDELLWKSLNIPNRRMSIMALDHLLRRNIKFLSISHANIYDDIAYKFETPLPKLQYLDMSAVFMNVEVLKSLLSQCNNLVKLSLENCQVDHACCENIGKITKLKVLNMASTVGLDKIGLQHILSLNNLEELNVSWAIMKDDDLHYLVSNMTPSVKRLNISGFLKQLADYNLISLVYRCPQLIELDISDSLAITSDSLDFILHNQSNLNVLSLNRCYNIGAASFQPNALKMKLNNSIHQLKELNIFGMTNHLSSSLFVNNTLEININKSMFSRIARPKPADNEHAIWEITVFIDC